jgi:hypothetical protein
MGTEKLWCHGIEIGRIEFEFLVNNNLYLKQNVAGVHTEKGVIKSSPNVVEGSSDKTSKELKSLREASESLYDTVFQLQSQARARPE